MDEILYKEGIDFKSGAVAPDPRIFRFRAVMTSGTPDSSCQESGAHHRLRLSAQVASPQRLALWPAQEKCIPKSGIPGQMAKKILLTRAGAFIHDVTHG